MVKNRLEKYFSRWLKHQRGMYSMKLQVNAYAHTKTVADFLVLTNRHNLAIECKMCDMTRGHKSFSFDRLTQKRELQRFQSTLNRNIAYILLMFWTGRLQTSEVYLIPLGFYLEIERASRKKSINYLECREKFKDCTFGLGVISNTRQKRGISKPKAL